MPSSSQYPMHLLPPCQPGGVTAAGGGGRQVGGQPDRGEHLLLLRAQVVGVEGDRLLHRGQRQQLQQVVLQHVAGGADAVVVPGAAADADVLGHGDLHVVDVVAVPDRLEQLVREAQRQDVLHGLLAEVVVDAEHRLRREDVLDDGVEFARAPRSCPNGFSITTRRQGPAVGRLLGAGRAWSWRTTRGRTSAGSTGRTRGCRRCRGCRRAPTASQPSVSKAASSAKSPCTKRKPPTAAPRPPRGTGCGRALAPRRCTTWAKSWSAQSRRA